MATTSTPENATTDSLLASLTNNRKLVGLALAAVGACFLIAPIVLLSKRGVDHALNPLFFWGVVCAAASIIFGLLLRGEPTGKLTATEHVRVLLMTWGSLVGLFTVLLGLSLPFSEEYKAIFAGGLKEWREKPQVLVWTGVAFLGGLGILFASLLLARGVERESGWMRRLLYGYNAILSALLLLTVLLLMNVLVYVRLTPFSVFSKQFDWTASQIYSLSQATEGLLNSLNEPVKIYILGLNGAETSEVENLLETCRSVTDQITWVELSPDRNRSQVIELIDKYDLSGSRGLLLVYGTEPNERTDFIEHSDLFPDLGSPQEERGFVFAGEAALFKSLTYLSEGKKIVVYFLQGNGELDLNDLTLDRPDVGLGLLKRRLSEGNFDPRPLTLGIETTKIPEDAEVIVIARPTRALPKEVVEALRGFVSGKNDQGKKGRLLIALDVVTSENKMVETGLEGLLADHNVKVHDDRIIGARTQDLEEPTELRVYPNPNSPNPIAEAFWRSREDFSPFRFSNARTVTSLNQANPAARQNPYDVDSLVLVDPRQLIWGETNLAKNPRTEVAFLRKDREALIEKISQRPLVVGVAVGEPKAPSQPFNPHDFRNRETEPVMVVFGDASWMANDTFVRGDGGEQHFALFQSSVSWLRGKPTVGTAPVENKERKLFRWKPPEEDRNRIIFLPGFLLVVGILGLGIGVWVVRRR